MWIECLRLFWTFLRIGFLGFGGGYAMLSMIMQESLQYNVTPVQLADMNALDMIVPGAIAINAATYVGFLHLRHLGLFPALAGATAATIGVSVPSFVLAVIMMRFLDRFKDNVWMKAVLNGIKPAAVGLIAAAAITIASTVLTTPGYEIADVWSQPLVALSWPCVGIFVVAAIANIRFNVNPILLTVLAGVVGALLMA